MAETLGLFSGAGFAIFVACAVVLLIAWVALPLAMFGTKPILREILAEVRKMNALLEKR